MHEIPEPKQGPAPPSSNEIIDGKLYLGNLSANQHRKELGITHVVSVCPDCPSTGPNHLSIPVQDNEYEDILGHIPKACEFIEKALGEGGKVLVHCVMGVSRSATVVAAYLIKTREMDVMEALKYIKARRSQIQPNYGFFKQLEVYAKCRYDPKPSSAVYRSWKRRYIQEVRCYLTHVEDVATVVPGHLSMASDLPENEQQARHLLQEFGITHILVIGSLELPSVVKDLGLEVHQVEVTDQQQRLEDDSWPRVVPSITEVIERAVKKNGHVFVYSTYETKAYVAVCAYLMISKGISSQGALVIIEECEPFGERVPLFTPTETFTRQLKLLDSQLLSSDPSGPLDAVDELAPSIERGCKIQETEGDSPKQNRLQASFAVLTPATKERPHVRHSTS